MKKACRSVLALALALALPGCGGSDTLTEQPVPESPPAQTEPAPQPAPEPVWSWQHDLPENRGLDSAALDELHQQLAPTDVLASVIVKNGAIVDEYYQDGYDASSVFPLHSCSKSVTSALVGIAINQGYIAGVNVPISSYFPQILQSDSAWRKQITIWHLLTHTSGISSSDDDVWEAWRNSENWVEYVLNRPVTSEPGAVFSYTTGGTHLLAAILQQATGKTAYEYGKEVLFDPLDMDSVQCSSDAQGISDGGNGFSMNIYDMAKFGQLYLNGGVWEGKQIVPAQWVTDSTSLQFDRSAGSADYGYQWWVRTFGRQQYPAYFSQGHGGQFIFVVPQLELVAVFTSNHTGSSSMYWQFVEDIVAACQPQ